MDPDLLPELPAEVKAGPMLARADIRPATFNEKTLEVEVDMGSGVPVVRVPWFDEPFLEELSMDPGAIRMERLSSGRMPFLDSHQRFELENQIGVVLSGRVESGKLVCTVRFSRRADVSGVVQDVRDGILGNLSLGYRVHKYQEVTLPTDTMRRLRAIDWEPMECSLVTVPADPTSEVRTAAPAPKRATDGALTERTAGAWTNCRIQGRKAKHNTMTPEEIAALEAARAAQQPAGTPATTPAPASSQATANPADEQLRIERAVQAERSRFAEALRLQNQHRLSADFASRMVANPAADLATIQRAALEELAARSAAAPTTSHVPVEMGAEPRTKCREAISNALLVRVGVDRDLTPMGREFSGRRITQCAEDFFSAMGVNTRRLSRDEFANLALKGQTGGYDDPTRGLMGTGDFASLLANAQNKAMRKRYDASPQTWLAIARRSESPDFKPMSRIQLSGGTQLKRVNEHGEFERGSLSDQAETYSLNTEGLIYGFTRKAFLNDDLGELDRITARMGSRAADRRSDLVWGLVTANANLADAVAWFHATHLNLATGGGSALQLTSLATMKAAMRKQVDANGNILNVMPRILAVPAALEITALQLTTQLTPNISSSVNPFQGAFERVIVEPRLDGNSATAWYAFASPDQYDVIEYAELSGQSGPQIMVRNGFEVDGIEFRVHDDFGAAPLEYVSAYKAAGV
jgi:phage head maturation protease